MFEGLFRLIDKAVEVMLKLRKKTHNRLASLVVFAGVAMISQKFWVPIVIQLIEKNQDMDIPDFRSEPVGVFLIMIGLSYHYLSAKNDRGELKFSDDQILEHDAAILTAQFKIVTYEQIREYLSNLEADHSYYMKEHRKFGNLLHFWSNEENKLMSNDVAQNLDKLLENSLDLGNFIDVSFFVFPNLQKDSNNYRLCMFPDHNCDRGGHGTSEQDVFYSQKSEELEKLVEKVKNSLKEYIAATKAEYGKKAILL